jgi:hypothetical protein
VGHPTHLGYGIDIIRLLTPGTKHPPLACRGITILTNDPSTMKRQRVIFWIGLLIYAVSFALIAVGDSIPRSAPMRGYYCAGFAFVLPLQSNPWRYGDLFEARKLEYFSLLISGWINVVFLLFVMMVLSKASRTFVSPLRIVIPCMIPFCWIVFHYDHSYPREGHFLWLASMLLVLFSARAGIKAGSTT